jgi:hypothetical protein
VKKLFCLKVLWLLVWLVLLPNGINNLIWGFVGFQSKTAKAIEEQVERILKQFISIEWYRSDGLFRSVHQEIDISMGTIFSNYKDIKKDNPKEKG